MHFQICTNLTNAIGQGWDPGLPSYPFTTADDSTAVQHDNRRCLNSLNGVRDTRYEWPPPPPGHTVSRCEWRSSPWSMP